MKLADELVSKHSFRPGYECRGQRDDRCNQFDGYLQFGEVFDGAGEC